MHASVIFLGLLCSLPLLSAQNVGSYSDLYARDAEPEPEVLRKAIAARDAYEADVIAGLHERRYLSTPNLLGDIVLTRDGK